MLGELIWEKLKLKTSDLRDLELEFDPITFLQVLNTRLKLTIGLESFLSFPLRKKKRISLSNLVLRSSNSISGRFNQLEI